MAGWETLFAALGGLVLGAGLATFMGRQRERRWMRERVATESRLRRDVLPVLERRADTMGIPPSQRGQGVEDVVELVGELGRVIKREEESGDLPFGDTLEASRRELEDELAGERS